MKKARHSKNEGQSMNTKRKNCPLLVRKENTVSNPSRRDFLRATAATAGGMLAVGGAALAHGQRAGGASEPTPDAGAKGGDEKQTQVEALARFAVRAKFEDLSAESRKQLPVHILDS